MKIISTIVFVISFVFCAVALEAQEEIKLKYDFKAGKKLNYQIAIDGDVTVEVKPADGTAIPKNTAKIQGKFSYSHEIASVADDGSAKINVIYGTSLMNTIVNDKVIPNNDVSQLNGKVARLTVEKNGEIRDYKLPDGLPISLQNADFKKMFLIFPDRDLEIGESWTENSDSVNDSDDNYVLENVVTLKRTLLGIEKKGNYECAKVKVQGSTKTTTKSKKKELKIGGDAQADIDGMIYFDLKSGYIVYSDLNTKINNVVVTGQNAGDAKGEEKKSSEITTIMSTNLKAITELL